MVYARSARWLPGNGNAAQIIASSLTFTHCLLRGFHLHGCTIWLFPDAGHLRRNGSSTRMASCSADSASIATDGIALRSLCWGTTDDRIDAETWHGIVRSRWSPASRAFWQTGDCMQPDQGPPSNRGIFLGTGQPAPGARFLRQYFLNGAFK